MQSLKIILPNSVHLKALQALCFAYLNLNVPSLAEACSRDRQHLKSFRGDLSEHNPK